MHTFNHYKYPKLVISFLKCNSIFFATSLSNIFFQSFFLPKLKNFIFSPVSIDLGDSSKPSVFSILLRFSKFVEVNELSIFRKVYGNWELPKRNPETLKTSVETIFLPIQAHPMLCLDNKLHQVITMYEDKIPVDFVEGLIRYLKDNCWYYTDVNAPKITFVVNFVVSENDRNELIRNRVEIVDLSLMALPGLEVDWGPLNVLITEFFIRSSIVEANESPDTEIAKQIARLTIPNAKMLREHMLALSTNVGDVKAALSNSQRRGQFGEHMFEDLLKKAGLEEGLQYIKQPTMEGGRRPDFAILLPADTHQQRMSLNVDCKFNHDFNDIL